MATKKRNEEEIEDVRRLLPLLPPQEVIETVKGKMTVVKLIYQNGYYYEPITGIKQNAVLVHCTACGNEFYLAKSYAGCGSPCRGFSSDPFGFIDPLDNEVKYSYKECLCPECGAPAQALHVGRISNTGVVIEHSFFLTLHNVCGHFAALAWVLRKSVDKSGRLYYDVKRSEGIALIGGRPVRYVGYENAMYYGYPWLPNWTVRARWRDAADEWDEDEIFTVDEDVFMTSNAEKSALDVYIKKFKKKIRVGAYLHLWSKYPQIENLTRSGLTPFVGKLIEVSTRTQGYGYGGNSRAFSIKLAEKHINRKAVKPFEILGLDKPELQLANRLSIEELELYKQAIKERGIRLSVEQIKQIERIGISSFNNTLKKASELGYELPMIRTLNYLRAQHDADGSDTSTLRDYWDMVVELEKSLPAEKVFPKHLKAAHDQVMGLVQQKKNKATSEAIAKYAEELKPLEFEDKETGLFIRAAASHEELINEGKYLHHCVGTYAKSVANRRTSIFFIRHIDEPEVPFFTLELQGNIVQQNRGDRNCARTPEVEAFESKWLKYLKEINYGKRNNRSIAAGAGA
jgi:hypothetical protein